MIVKKAKHIKEIVDSIFLGFKNSSNFTRQQEAEMRETPL